MAIKGYNTLVEVKDSGGTWHELMKVKQNDIFKSSRAVVDITTNRSPGGHEEKDTTLLSTAPLKLDCIYNDSDPTHSLESSYGLQYLLKFDIKCDVRFTLSSGKAIEYRGKFTDFDLGQANPNNIIECSTVFTPTEAPLSGA